MRDLGRNFDQHCIDDDRRHDENVRALRELGAKMTELVDVVKPLATAITIMQPIVDSYQISRWKFTGALMLAGSILTLVGWVLSLAAGKLLHLVGFLRA